MAEMKTIKFPVFVGHVYNKDQLDDLRDALESALEELDFVQLVYADTARYHGALFPKIAQLIDSSMFCIFDVSEQNTNVFLEFGYAMGRGKLCVPIIRSGATVPSDIAGFERLVYSSYKELSQEIASKIQGIIHSALQQKGPLKVLAHNEFIWHLRHHTAGQELDVDVMKRELRSHGISGLEIDETIETWLKEGFVEKHDGKISISPLGEDFVIKVIKSYPELSKRDLS